MDLSRLPRVLDFNSPDDYVRAVLFQENSTRKIGKLQKIRRLAASCGISDAMLKDRDSLISDLVSKIGWRGVYDGVMDGIGAIYSDFLNLGVPRKKFLEMRDLGEIRENGKYRYTRFGKSSYSPCYNIYDYFRIKMEAEKQARRGEHE